MFDPSIVLTNAMYVNNCYIIRQESLNYLNHFAKKIVDYKKLADLESEANRNVLFEVLDEKIKVINCDLSPEQLKENFSSKAIQKIQEFTWTNPNYNPDPKQIFYSVISDVARKCDDAFVIVLDDENKLSLYLFS